MVRREVNSPTTIKYSLSNADEQTSVNKLAQMQATLLDRTRFSRRQEPCRHGNALRVVQQVQAVTDPTSKVVIPSTR
jgi:hypothetical protein